MQESLGNFLRRMRREQNLTQSELGDSAFSKSYVSAVESDKLSPSIEALQHFAHRLGKAEDYFLVLSRQMHPRNLLQQTPLANAEMAQIFAQEKAALFDTLLEQSELVDLQPPDTCLTLSSDALALLKPTQQAHYYFSRGLFFKKSTELSAAISAFEAALVREDHPRHLASILDELSQCYWQTDFFQVAISYALRAHQQIVANEDLFAGSALPFRIELHCGEAYLACGNYSQALEHFTLARRYLNSRQVMQNAGRLYRALGYCTYALAYQQAYEASKATGQIELQYQQALGHLVQSRVLAQMGGGDQEESNLRLLLARVQLDLASWLRGTSSQEEQERPVLTLLRAKVASLLDDTNEQCRQTLLGFRQMNEKVIERTSSMFMALAALLRTSVQRALLAYESGYESSFQRERSFATTLCQHVLDAYQNEELLETIVWNIGNLPEPFVNSPAATLPSLPDVLLAQKDEEQDPLVSSKAEVYWAVGELAEMLGRTSTTQDFINSCYACADTCFLRALTYFKLGTLTHYYDAGDLTRASQRYTVLLHERLRRLNAADQDVEMVARALLILCQQHLFTSPEKAAAMTTFLPAS